MRRLMCVAALLAACTTLARAALVINEVHYNPPGSGDATEFIEFCNTGGAPLSLSGWQMSDGVEYTFPPQAVVPAGGFLVLAFDPLAFVAAYPQVTNVYGPFANGTRLNNDGERVAISDAGGTLVGAMTYDDVAPWPTAPDGNGPTLELRHPLLDPESPASWAASLASGGTPGATNSTFVNDAMQLTTARVPQSPVSTAAVLVQVTVTLGTASSVVVRCTAPGGWLTNVCALAAPNVWTCALPARADGTWVEYVAQAVSSNGVTYSDPPAGSMLYRVMDSPIQPRAVIINEIMYHSSVDALDEPYEYVELWNISAQTVDLAGCVFEDTRLPTNAWLVPPGALVVLADEPRALLNSVYPPIAAERFAQIDIGLSDDGETLRFKSPNDVTLHAVTYGNNGGWPSAPNGFGPSLELTSALLDDQRPGSWAASLGFGTPGSPNSVLATGTQLAVVGVAISPSQPLGGAPVFITARPLASVAITAFEVYYRTNATQSTAVMMVDDGAHGDGAAGDGVFGATLPAFPDGTIVWYYLRLQLADGATLVVPPGERVVPPPSPGLTVRLTNGGLQSLVTPTASWQVYTNSGAATGTTLYLYLDGAGEVLADDVAITYLGTDYVSNGTFATDLKGWTLGGNHSGSYFDPSAGARAPGCLHLRATGAGGGSSGNNVRQIASGLVSDGRIYTLTFAYRGVVGAETYQSNWYFYHVGPASNLTVCISEINYHTMHDGMGNFEFVELYNYGAAPVNLAQWTLENEDGARFAITREAWLPPGGCAVLCGDVAAMTNYYDLPSAQCHGPLPFRLSNGDDVLTLRAWDGRIVDVVAYADAAPWPARADGDGATLERISPVGGGAAATNWQASVGGGSPGFGNGGWGANILGVWHSPVVPRSSEPITVFARVTNIAGGVRVYYRPNESGVWLTQAMSAPDGNAVCSATLGTFSSGSYIPFFCEYSTAVTRVRFPTAGTRQPALLEVDDTQDTYVLPVWRLLFTSDNWNTLYNRAWLWDNTDVDATLLIGTQIFYNIGTHFRGNYSRTAKSAHNMYLNYGQTWRGHRKLSLAYNWEHASRVIVPYAQEMYKRMGVPIFDTSMTILKRRGSELGLRHYIEPFDEAYMRSNGFAGGNLYKAAQADRQQALFTFAGYTPALYENCYEANGSLDPAHEYTDLARGLEALYALPPDVFATQATNYLDPVAFGREQAMYHYLFNSDGWPQWGQNYLLHGNAGGRMGLYAQDIGAVMVWYGWPVYPTVAGVNRFLRLPEVARVFWSTYTNAFARISSTAQREYVDVLYNQAKDDMSTSFQTDCNSLKSSISTWYSSGGAESPNAIAAWNFVWLSVPNRCVLVNEPYYYRAVAFDTVGRSITYSLSAAPAWLGIDSATGEIRGTPTTPGAYTFQARAYNGVSTLVQVCTVVVQQPGVRLQVHCDEGSGTTAADSSGFNNHGTRQNTVTWAAGGRYSNCLYFGASSSDRLAFNTASSLNIEGDFTFETWLKFTQKNKSQSLIFEKFEELGFDMGQDGTVMGGRMWYGPFDNGNEIADGLGGHGYVLMRYNEDGNARLMQTGVWHHVAVTHERDRNEVYIYLNNQRIGGLVWNDNLLSNLALRVGGPFDGWMDEMKMSAFARKAFNVGLSMDIVRYAAPRAYIQFSLYGGGAVSSVNLRNFALRVEPAGTWHPLPDVVLTAGGTARVDVTDIPGLAELPASGALALYPFEPATIYPAGNYRHTCTRILDYVAWGMADTAPAPTHPAVQAGLWQAGAVVLTLSNTPGRILLRAPGQNNRGALSWVGGTTLPAPLLTPAPSTNLAPAVPLYWQAATGASSYDLDCSGSALFDSGLSTNVVGTNAVVNLAEGRWYWRARSRAGALVSGYRTGNAFDVIPEPMLVLWLGLAALVCKRKGPRVRP